MTSHVFFSLQPYFLQVAGNFYEVMGKDVTKLGYHRQRIPIFRKTIDDLGMEYAVCFRIYVVNSVFMISTCPKKLTLNRRSDSAEQIAFVQKSR